METVDISIGGKTYKATPTVPRAPHVEKVVQLQGGDTPYYCAKVVGEARLGQAGLLPYTCTCPDFQQRRMYREGEDGICKHIKALREVNLL